MMVFVISKILYTSPGQISYSRRQNPKSFDDKKQRFAITTS